MTYPNSYRRSVGPLKSASLQPMGRTPLLTGLYLGFIKDNTDVQKNGRLRVWIPEFGSPPDQAESWIKVWYSSPFAGATNVDTNDDSRVMTFEGTQTSYGMWMIPPDINNQVLVMFINGNPSRGVFIGCLYNQFMNNMVPAMASTRNNYQYPEKFIPGAEYNKHDTRITQPDAARRPYEGTKFRGVSNQGLINDTQRGVTDSSARREAPSQVFGIITPGPILNPDVASKDPAYTRRKGGSSFVMDDKDDSEYVQLATKSGAQVKINESTGAIYVINRDGTSWIQMDHLGNVDIFGARHISMRAQYDFNIRADRNVNIEAGQNVYIKAAKDTKKDTTTFTYDVNNKPITSTIPVFKYVGENKGDGGKLVLQSQDGFNLNNKGDFAISATGNLNISAGGNINSSAGLTQNISATTGIRLSSQADIDLYAKGLIRASMYPIIGVTDPGCPDTTMPSTGATSTSKKPTNKKLNILATWKSTVTYQEWKPNVAYPLGDIVSYNKILYIAKTDVPPTTIFVEKLWEIFIPEDKFKRNSETILTTVSRLPTYEPCPEHLNFSLASLGDYKPVLTAYDTTYGGSGGSGGGDTVPPSVTEPPPTDTWPPVPPPSPIPGDGTDPAASGINLDALRCQLVQHEGLKTATYKDSVGLLTGGIGHLLRSNEISQFPLGTQLSTSQIETWYSADSAAAISIAQDLFSTVWTDLSSIRKRAVTDLAFNLGKAKLAKFVNFCAAMRAKNYQLAGQELRNSVWYGQVGRRGPNIIAMIVQDQDATNCDKKFPG